MYGAHKGTLCGAPLKEENARVSNPRRPKFYHSLSWLVVGRWMGELKFLKEKNGNRGAGTHVLSRLFRNHLALPRRISFVDVAL